MATVSQWASQFDAHCGTVAIGLSKGFNFTYDRFREWLQSDGTAIGLVLDTLTMKNMLAL